MTMERRDEAVVRLVEQELRRMGLADLASKVEGRAGIAMDSPAVCSFKDAFLRGDSASAEDALIDLGASKEGRAMLLIRRQQLVELVLQNSAEGRAKAIELLRDRVSQDHGPDAVRDLTRILTCTTAEQVEQVFGKPIDLRYLTLREIEASLSDNSALGWLPEGRLAELLDQAVSWQRLACPLHFGSLNENDGGDLIRNHRCSSRGAKWGRTGRGTSLGSSEPVAIEPVAAGLVVGFADGQISTVIEGCIARLGPGHSTAVTRLRASPDGRWLVSCSQECVAVVWDLSGRREHCRIRFADWPASILWMPDSRAFLVGSYADESKGIRRVTIRSEGVKVEHIDATAGSVTEMEWIDSEHILIVEAPRRVSSLCITDGKLVRIDEALIGGQVADVLVSGYTAVLVSDAGLVSFRHVFDLGRELGALQLSCSGVPGRMGRLGELHAVLPESDGFAIVHVHSGRVLGSYTSTSSHFQINGVATRDGLIHAIDSVNRLVHYKHLG